MKINPTLLMAVLGLTMSAITAQSASPPSEASQIATLQSQVAALTATVNALLRNPALQMGPFVTVDSNTENGVIGPHIVFHGANVHVVNGTGATSTVNGLGNLIVGYDEIPINSVTLNPGERSGSHNLVVGPYSKFTAAAYAGCVLGIGNYISNAGATVLGGIYNTADGPNATVVGGYENTSSGQYSIVVGGSDNDNEGVQSQASVIVGGVDNLTDSSGAANSDVIIGAVILGGFGNAIVNTQPYYSVILGGSEVNQGVISGTGNIFSGTINYKN